MTAAEIFLRVVRRVQRACAEGRRSDASQDPQHPTIYPSLFPDSSASGSYPGTGYYEIRLPQRRETPKEN